jgi:hypothetical protein
MELVTSRASSGQGLAGVEDVFPPETNWIQTWYKWLCDLEPVPLPL